MRQEQPMRDSNGDGQRDGVEMDNLAPTAAAQTDSQPSASDPTEARPQSDAPAPSSQLESTPSHPPLDRSQTAEAALGPDDAPLPTTSTSGPNTLQITLLLSNGARHPYNINEKYLRSRKVDALNSKAEFDPREMSGYKLKELIWTDWRPEWESKPRDPSAIRLILWGRFIEDKVALKGMS